MSEARVRLAKLTGDELAADVSTIVHELPVLENATAVEYTAEGQPKLTEAVRALLIMVGCDATYAKTHWVIRRSKISAAEEDAYARASLRNRGKLRFQTALPIESTFKDWQGAVMYLTGDSTKP